MTSDDGAPEVTTVEARPVVVLARYRRGTAGEAARTVHVVPHPPVASGAVAALCGALLTIEHLETVTPDDGMPCTMCLLYRSTAPKPPEAPPRDGNVSAAEPVAAAGYYRAWGWPVTVRRDQVLLNLDRQVVALLIPTGLATEVETILTTRRCTAPVLAHPDAPGHRVVLAGEPFWVPLPWPPEVRPTIETLPLPPTVTPRGPVTWVQLPHADSLRLCREIDIFAAVHTALRDPPPP
ncbi:MAG: hypothetical protein ACRDT0_19820 [Pseudonocardiaceae bacterium]